MAPTTGILPTRTRSRPAPTWPTSSTATVIAGNQLTYTITVTNNGPSDAQGVSLADSLDLALTGETWTLDTVAQGPWMGMAILGTMTPGQVHTIVITATVDPATPEGFEIENEANAASSTTDPNPANNSSENDHHGRDRGRSRHRQDRAADRHGG